MRDYFLENITEEEFVSTFGDAEEYINETHVDTDEYTTYTILTIWRGMDHMKNISKSGIFKYDYIVSFYVISDYVNVSVNLNSNDTIPDDKYNITFKLLAGIKSVIESFIKKHNIKTVLFTAVNEKMDRFLYALSQSKKTLVGNKWGFIKTTKLNDRNVYHFEKV